MPVQSMVPAGVPPGPVTVAVNTRVPPVTMAPALSVTTVCEAAGFGETGPSLPLEPE